MYNGPCRMHNAYFTMHNTRTMYGGLRPPASIIHNASTITTKCPTHNSHFTIRNAHDCIARSDARNDPWRPSAAHHYPVQYAMHNTQRTMHSAQCSAPCTYHNAEAQHTMHDAQYTTYNAQCIMHNAQCVRCFSKTNI